MRFVVVGVLTVALGFAAGRVAAEQDLESVEAELRGARNTVVETERAAGGALGELEAFDRMIEQREKQLGSVRADARAAERTAGEARRRVEEVNTRLGSLRERLGQRLAAVYRLRQRGLGPALLGDPATLDRRLGWFRDILEYDRKLVREVEWALLEARTVADEAAAAAAALAAVHRKEERMLARLGSERKQKAATLAALRDEGQRKAGMVRELESAATRIWEMVLESDTVSLVPGGAGWLPPLGRHRGEVVAARNGVEIPSVSGAAIRAAAAGRVVFADWFPGYGKMVIVDHGEHVHSIYGYAAVLAVVQGRRGEGRRGHWARGEHGACPGSPSLLRDPGKGDGNGSGRPDSGTCRAVAARRSATRWVGTSPSRRLDAVYLRELTA